MPKSVSCAIARPERSPLRRALRRNLNEDDLVAALRAIVDDGMLPGRITLGIGDDAAAWQPSRSHLSVITTDALVDGVHFKSDSMDAFAIGHRAFASNLSDIAAMGARPVLATIALGVGAHADEAWILACYRGMQTLAKRFATRIVGGDIVRAPATMLSITIVGEVSRTRMKTRAAAKPGDVLAVTGTLGASRAGLDLMRAGVEGAARFADLAPDLRERAERAFAFPEPRVREGRFLAASAHVRAMMDTSDGLSTDLARLARACKCGADLETIPVDPSAAAIARANGDDPERYALDGGEDFELLIAVQSRAFDHLASRFRAHFGKPLVRIGRLARHANIERTIDGMRFAIDVAGYDHLLAADRAD